MRIQEYLDDKNTTAYALAEAAGVSRQALYTILRKGTEPSLDTAVRLNIATRGAVDFTDMLQPEREADLSTVAPI